MDFIINHIFMLIESNRKRLVFNRFDLVEIEFLKEKKRKRTGFVEIEESNEDDYQVVSSINFYTDSQYYSTGDGKHHIHYFDSNGAKGVIRVSKNPFMYFSKVNRLYRILVNLKSN